uniref:Uncharacterized protein n=1 Tax=Arundo donax TaxID=35708 RepID=A0A0A9E2P3_ARUDO
MNCPSPGRKNRSGKGEKEGQRNGALLLL